MSDPQRLVRVRCCAWREDVLCSRVYETLYGTWARPANVCPDCGHFKAMLLDGDDGDEKKKDDA